MSHSDEIISQLHALGWYVVQIYERQYPRDFRWVCTIDHADFNWVRAEGASLPEALSACLALTKTASPKVHFVWKEEPKSIKLEDLEITL